MSPFSGWCLLCDSANWLHIASIAYEFQALQNTHYQHIIVTIDVDKWMQGVATQFKRTGTTKHPAKIKELVKRQCFVNIIIR